MKSLGDRMKQYENSYNISMTNRLPVIIRLDGNRFSKLTKKLKFDKPFDSKFSYAMSSAMLDTAKKLDGCVFGYTQSDEITLVLKNDQSNDSMPWFNNRIQKMVSIAASLATANFNKRLGSDLLGVFDARTFVVPNWIEAANCLIWRQNDCSKNSISAACYYEVAKKHGKKTTRKMMHQLNQKQQQELLFQKAAINWDTYAPRFKRGIGCYKVTEVVEQASNHRTKWKLDVELPIFAKNHEFLLNLLEIPKESSDV